MFNELPLEIIASIAIAILLGAYIVIKRNKNKETSSDITQTSDTPKTPTPNVEPQTPAPKIQEVSAPKIINIYENHEVEETVVPAPTPKEEIFDTSSRRKSDKTIPKRTVPAHGKITKHSFVEFTGERILVAEDNLINQKVLSGLLAESGIELVMANDGQEALDILENDTNFLMILMDAHMPRIDGFEATRTIRANSKYDHILVVALSGDTAVDDIKKMREAGMSEQLEKPLRMEFLYNIFYAYTDQKTKPNKEDELVEVIMTKDLNGDIGLETCGGDEEFYREILGEFILNYSTSSDTLGEFLRSNDLASADKLLLDILGITSNIGAIPLSEIASNLKLSLSDTQEKSYFSLLDQYKVHLERLAHDIKEYL